MQLSRVKVLRVLDSGNGCGWVAVVQVTFTRESWSFVRGCRCVPMLVACGCFFARLVSYALSDGLCPLDAVRAWLLM